MNVEVSLVLQLLFVSRTLKNVFVGIFRGAASCKWGKVAVMVWSVDGSRFSYIYEPFLQTVSHLFVLVSLIRLH